MELRDVFSHQPARILFLDVSPPINLHTIDIICNILKDLTALSLSIKGSQRLNALGIYCLAQGEECVFPIQSLKQNFSKLSEALDRVKVLHATTVSCKYSFNAQVGKAMHNAVEHYVSHFQEQFLSREEWPPLELTLLSPQPVPKIAKEIEEYLGKIQVSHVKKIQVVSIAPLFGRRCHMPREAQTFPNREPSPELFDVTTADISEEDISAGCLTTDELFSGILEIRQVNDDRANLECFFRSWLQDVTIESDHFRLHFPEKDMTLRCDMHEVMISPDCLPAGIQFHCAYDAGTSHMVVPNRTRKDYGKVPVHILEVVNLVNRAGVCESLVYGQPFVISHTQCWKIDWKELVNNRYLFSAVNKYLWENNLVLIAKRKVPTLSSGILPTGMFILFPSKNNRILVKPLAVKELMVPLTNVGSCDSEDIPEYLLRLAKDCLESLPVNNGYNPFDFSSGLQPFLTTALKKCRGPRAHSSAATATGSNKKAGRSQACVLPFQKGPTPSEADKQKPEQLEFQNEIGVRKTCELSGNNIPGKFQKFTNS